MKRYIIAILLSCSVLHAQEIMHEKFASPFDFPLSLSANFGELRANHLHGGLDFKTQGVIDKPIHCIADGYVSRITVSSGGYGNALYISHPNGYTSVYGHLNSFIPAISRYVEQYQYDHETFAVEIVPDSTMFYFKCGEIIAMSGNTGFSFGPHLHMEIRKTASNEPVDPLAFYLTRIKDTRPPVANSIIFYPQVGRGVVEGSVQKKTFSVVSSSGASCLEHIIEAWGDIGIGLSANDYMDGTHNNYGVQSVELFVDTMKVFESTVDCYSFDESRAINSWTDYSAYKKEGKWIMKSFVAPGNPLRILQTDENKGIIQINEERDFHFMYVLKDLHGNISRYSFIVRGKEQSIPEYYPDMRHFLRYDRTNVVQEPGLQLIIPKDMLYENVALDTKVRTDSSAISFEYQLHNELLPLHAGCELMLGVRHLAVKDTTKYFIERRDGKKRYSVGGSYENGWVKTKIRELGTFRIAVDTIAPRVVPVGDSSSRVRTIIYKVSDIGTGIKSYRGTVDGKFVLVAYSAKNGTLTARLEPKRVSVGKHKFSLIVEDYCGNKTCVERILNY